MNPQEIKKTLNSDVGKPLKEYLLIQLKELKQIDNVKEYGTPTHQAIELKAQKKAFEKLKEILDRIITIQDEDLEKPTPNEYGVGL